MLGADFMDDKFAGEKFAELLATMERLRGQNGCPWDKEQTHSSLKQFLLEEAHELLDALDDQNSPKLREELGDVLHQIVFHCQIAAEDHRFTAADVIVDLNQKMVRRHPHVFSVAALRDSTAVVEQWTEIKARENSSDLRQSALGNLPKSMPALARAQKITERAASVGFDWSAAEPVWQKVEEELNELKVACAGGSQARVEDEIGDLFFTLVNLARFLGVQSEECLQRSTEKFITRFHYIEERLRETGKAPAMCTLEELDRLWEEAKALEQSAGSEDG
jgi:tetrapyrrole methylase family protein/MazG family protein